MKYKYGIASNPCLIKPNSIFADTTIAHNIFSTIDDHESIPDEKVTSVNKMKFENKEDEEIKQEIENNNNKH